MRHVLWFFCNPVKRVISGKPLYNWLRIMTNSIQFQRVKKVNLEGFDLAVAANDALVQITQKVIEGSVANAYKLDCYDGISTPMLAADLRMDTYKVHVRQKVVFLISTWGFQNHKMPVSCLGSMNFPESALPERILSEITETETVPRALALRCCLLQLTGVSQIPLVQIRALVAIY